MNKSIILFFVLLILAISIWGFIGGQEAQESGVTCDMGIGKIFCWKWHTNLLGQAQEFADNTGNAVKDFFN